MGDTRAYFNTSYHDGDGITCRASQRGVFMRNYVESPRGSGLAVWHADEPYPAVDNVFAHNLVRQSDPSLHMQTEHPNFFDYNVYWPRKGSRLADGEEKNGKTPVYKDLDALRKATGHELHGEVRDAQPEDVGLGTVTFRVADAKNPDEVLSMIGNGGCEFEDPAGVNMLPYFWRAGTGDGAEHVFMYSIYCGTGHSGCLRVRRRRRHGAHCKTTRRTPSRKSSPTADCDTWRSSAASRPRCARRPGFLESQPAGPAGRHLRHLLLCPRQGPQAQGGTALAAFVEWSDATGQHVRAAGTGCREDLQGHLRLDEDALPGEGARRCPPHEAIPRRQADHRHADAGRHHDQG